MRAIITGLIILSALLSTTAVAAPHNAQGNIATTAEKGWFWQYWHELQAAQKAEAEKKKAKEAADKAREKAVAANKKKPKEQRDPCVDADKWRADCGFIDPGTDFEFQTKQRKALHHAAAMNPNDAKTVRALQRYTAWAVKQSFTMMQMWEWNRIQEQDLNATMMNPTAQFALAAMSRWNGKQKIAVMDEIRRQGGFLVFFSRASCAACESAVSTVRGVAAQTRLPAYEASLDGQCHEGFEGEYCHTGDLVKESASRLGVKYVPDMWLYLPEQDQWIRVSSGMESVTTITSRIKTFFNGVLAAVASGVQKAQGQMAPVDFSSDPITRSRGALGVGVPTTQSPMPNSQ